MLQLLVLLMCTSVFSHPPNCSKEEVLQNLRKSTYDFSLKLLDRVAEETDGNFVFSPISTWLQLLALSDGARGATLREIITLTNLDNRVCFKKVAREIFNDLDEELRDVLKRRSVFIIDELLNVKKEFVTNVETLNAAKVMPVNFRNTTESAFIVNKMTNGLLPEGFDADDFVLSVLLLIDVIVMKANWLKPFEQAFTADEMFYSHTKQPMGFIKMMYRTGKFNYTKIPQIDAQVLELPFNDRASMILMLPNNGPASSLFLSLNKIGLSSILSLLKLNRPKFINVKLPKFNITTEIDNVPEMLNDIGTHNVFRLRHANFKGISDYKVFVSMMKHKAHIEVTETGVTASLSSELMVKKGNSIDVSFNRPFAYFIVDKISNAILFAGIFSKPLPF